MEGLTKDDSQSVSDLLKLSDGATLETALKGLGGFHAIWQEFNDENLQHEVALEGRGPGAARALYEAARIIVEDSRVSEETFLIGTEVEAGEMADAVTEWRSAQRLLYSYAILPWIHRDDALEFVRIYREELARIARIAVPRHRFWRPPRPGPV